MERNDFLLVLVFLFVLSLASYGSYKVGRYKERRDLTQSLEDSLDSTCTQCWTIGKKYGYKKAMKECDNEPLQSGRY